MPKIDVKHALWIMPLILSCLMSASLSCINIYLSMGWFDGFMHKWLLSWLISWCFAFPLILIFIPIVRKLLSYVLTTPNKH